MNSYVAYAIVGVPVGAIVAAYWAHKYRPDFDGGCPDSDDLNECGIGFLWVVGGVAWPLFVGYALFLGLTYGLGYLTLRVVTAVSK